jgi:hypothetical protein
MMKPETVKKRVYTIERELDLIGRGLVSDHRIHAITDKIAWLSRYHHIDEETTERLCDMALEVMETINIRYRIAAERIHGIG